MLDGARRNNGPMILGGKMAQTDTDGHFKFASAGKGDVLRARWKNLATDKAYKVNDPTEEATLNLSAAATFSLEVDVNDKSTNTAIGGATVELITLSNSGGLGTNHTADARGIVTLPSLYLDTTYSVSAQMSGYGQVQQRVTNPQGNPRQETITLGLKKATSVISGIINDELGTPLANIEVYVNGMATGYQTTKTDDQGKFSFAVTDDAKDVIVSFRAPEGWVASHVIAKAGDADLVLAPHRPTTRPGR
jgi:hypothetical protein